MMIITVTILYQTDKKLSQMCNLGFQPIDSYEGDFRVIIKHLALCLYVELARIVTI